MIEGASEALRRSEPPSQPGALQHEIDVVREDLAENIRLLRQALSLRSQLRWAIRAHPGTVMAVAAVGGVLIALAIGRALRKRREHRAFASLLQPRADRWPSWPRLSAGHTRLGRRG